MGHCTRNVNTVIKWQSICSYNLPKCFLKQQLLNIEYRMKLISSLIL